MQWLKNLFGAGKSKPDQENTVMVRRDAGNLYVFRISGILNKTSADRIQVIAKQEIVRGTKNLKMLIILDEFKGWRKGDDWGDLNFLRSMGMISPRSLW